MLTKNCFYTKKLRQEYPEFRIVFSILNNSETSKLNIVDYLNNRKRETEDYAKNNLSSLLENTKGMEEFSKKLNSYNYHIKSLIKATAKGRPIKLINPLVDIVQFEEIKNSVLMGLHNLDKINGDIIFDVLDNNQKIDSLFNREILLEKNDVVIRDDEKIFGSVAKGPDDKTKVTLTTSNVIIFAFFSPPSEIIRASSILKSCTNEIENITNAKASVVNEPAFITL